MRNRIRMGVRRSARDLNKRRPADQARLFVGQGNWGSVQPFGDISTRRLTVAGTASSNSGVISSVERVPLVIKLGGKNLLLITQGSQDNAFDYSFSHIIARNSTDGGKTWGVPREIFRLSAYSEGSEWINIGAVSDEPDNAGQIHILFCVFTGSSGTIQRPYVLRLTSTDLGTTWNSPARTTFSGGIYQAGGTADISASVVKVSNSTPASLPTCYTSGDLSLDAPWVHFAFGPGKILKKSDGTLIAFANHRYSTTGTATERQSWDHSIYSTDNGATWALGGGYVESNNTTQSNTNEVTACIIDASDTILLSSRVVSGSNQPFRAITTVTSNTANWSSPTITTDLGGADCAGSMICPKRDGVVYHSLISNYNSNNTSQRNSLCLWKSLDSGATWSVVQTINHETSAYSDLTYLAAGRSFLCVFERCRDVSTFLAFAGEISSKLMTKKWVDRANIRTAVYYFNEGSSGAIPTTGRPLVCHGDIDGGGWGGSGATFTSTGASVTGAANGIFLQLGQAGSNPSNSYLNQRGGPWDWPAGEAITLQLIGIKTTSGSNVAIGKTVIGNRDAGSGIGWQINGSSSGQLTLTAFDGLGTDSSGSSTTGTFSRTNGQANLLNGTRRTIALSISADRSVVQFWKEQADGSFAVAGSAGNMSALTKGITGAVATMIGCRVSSPSDTYVASSGEGVDLYAVKIEHGIARTSGFTATADLVKESKDTYLNLPATPSTPSNDPTVIGTPQCWLLATRDNGLNAKVDQYGRFPAYMPRQRGSAALSYVDMMDSTRVFAPASNSRGLWYDTDSMVGPCYRMQYSTGAHASAYLIAPAIGIADWQLTMTFSFAGIFWFNSETGSSQTILDSCVGSNGHAGVWLARINSTGKIQLIISKDASGLGGTHYAFVDNAVGNVTINTGKPIFLGLKCSGSGKVRVAYGEYTVAGTAPTLTFTDSTGSIDTSGTPIASDLPLFVGDSYNTNAACDLRVVKNLLFYNTALADADFQSLASFGCQY